MVSNPTDLSIRNIPRKNRTRSIVEHRPSGSGIGNRGLRRSLGGTSQPPIQMINNPQPSQPSKPMVTCQNLVANAENTGADIVI